MATTIIKSWNSDNQAEVTPAHELKVTGTVTANNASVGPNGAPAPTSSTEVGGVNPSGNLEPLQVDASGALIVSGIPVFVSQNVRVLYNEVSSLAIGVETTINTYTAPGGLVISYLLSILNSGGNRGQFNIYLNGTQFDKQYTNVTQLTANFDYKTGSAPVPGMVIPGGQVLQVKAINDGTSTADYNSRFLILEVTT